MDIEYKEIKNTERWGGCVSIINRMRESSGLKPAVYNGEYMTHIVLPVYESNDIDEQSIQIVNYQLKNIIKILKEIEERAGLHKDAALKFRQTIAKSEKLYKIETSEFLNTKAENWNEDWDQKFNEIIGELNKLFAKSRSSSLKKAEQVYQDVLSKRVVFNEDGTFFYPSKSAKKSKMPCILANDEPKATVIKEKSPEEILAGHIETLQSLLDQGRSEHERLSHHSDMIEGGNKKLVDDIAYTKLEIEELQENIKSAFGLDVRQDWLLTDFTKSSEWQEDKSEPIYQTNFSDLAGFEDIDDKNVHNLLGEIRQIREKNSLIEASIYELEQEDRELQRYLKIESRKVSSLQDEFSALTQDKIMNFGIVTNAPQPVAA